MPKSELMCRTNRLKLEELDLPRVYRNDAVQIDHGSRTYLYPCDEKKGFDLTCFVIDNGTGKVCHVLEPENVRRDYRTEIEKLKDYLQLKLDVFLQSFIMKHLPEDSEYTRKKYESIFTLQNFLQSTENITYYLKNLFSDKETTNLADKQNLENEILAGFRLLDNLVSIVSTKGLLEGIFSVRAKGVEIAIADLHQGKSLKIGINAHITGGAGTLGIARLLQRSIQDSLPTDSKIEIFLHGRNGSTKAFSMSNSRRGTNHVPEIVINCQPPDFKEYYERISTGNFDIHALPSELARAGTSRIVENPNSISQTMKFALGSVPMDTSLLHRRKRADQKSIETIKTERKAWIENSITSVSQEELEKLINSRTGPCAYGFAYYQDVLGFRRNAVKLREMIEQNENKMKNSTYIYFLSHGKHAENINGIASSNEISKFCNAVVINEYGVVYDQHTSSNPEKARLIFVAQSLKHEAVLTLLSELHGWDCKQHVEGGSTAWTQVPALVTGNASFFEAKSSLLPTFHDGFDVKKNGFDLFQEQLNERMNLMGISLSPDNSRDFETLTKNARNEADFFFHQNYVDDLIIAFSKYR